MMNLLYRFSGSLVPLVAALAALAVGAVVIIVLGASPLVGYGELVKGAFGSGDALADTAVRAMPLLLVGTGICIAFRASVINIGGEGQIVAGALLSTVTALAVPNLPAIVLIPVVMLAGIIGGGIWGAIPGALKAYLGVNEILSTIMLNIVAIQVMNYLLRDPLIDPLEIERGTRIPQTERLSENADLPILIEGTRLHLGVVIALLASVVAWVFLWRTTVGFKTRAVGHNSAAANYAGMPFKRMTMLALTYSGAMCGLAGAVLVFGSQSHRLITDGSSLGFTGSSGFNGIVAALFGGLHPLWTIPSSFLFGGLLVGANAMQRAIQIDSALVIGLNGLIVVFVVSSSSVRDRLRQAMEISRMRTHGATADQAPSAGSSVPDGDAESEAQSTGVAMPDDDDGSAATSAASSDPDDDDGSAPSSAASSDPDDDDGSAPSSA
ncbi:MAG: ABC transporter permease, partial [Acidimicrobiaceae bacterium]|nr:ABC transporter permease [Acidimicrobiaceae bacterium]MXW74962.1 ABC transporter permease [Acidimicrobiaceae bacterium]MYG55805.1 ABC transporter permease [Acidimicrobiaceae bacterium]